MRRSYMRHGVSADNSKQNRCFKLKKVRYREVQKSYGHNKHIHAILSAHNAVRREHEGANRGDDVLV
jgi:hypothetical protein